LPLSSLQKIEGKRDSHNNNYFAPQKSKELEGEHTRVVYVAPKDRSPLEVLRNYQDEVEALGGKVLYECKKAQCGGDANRGVSGGGGDMSLAMFFAHEEDILKYAKLDSVAYYALGARINDLHYFNAFLPKHNNYISVMTYSSNSDEYSLNNRTIVVLDAVSLKKREHKMVLIKADKMAKEIAQNGQISLYGIYFDTDKVAIKPSSKPTLKEIAKLLKSNPKLHILIVGHTDNQGEFNYNLKLSQKRAKAVADTLVKSYGIKKNRLRSYGVSYAAPAASNDTEEGRAKNRRVVLVKDR